MTRQTAVESPPVNVYESSDQLTVAIPIPGAHHDTVNVGLEGRQLTVDAEARYPQEQQHYVQHEWTVRTSHRVLAPPRPGGARGSRAAAVVAVLEAAAAVALSLLSGFGPLAFLLVLLGLACGWAYDLKLKRTPLSFLPFAVAFPLVPIWVAMIAGRPLEALGPVLLGGIPLAVSIHLADAIPDRAPDRAAGVNTLAVTLGRPGAEIAAVGLLLGGALASLLVLTRQATRLSFGLSIVALAGGYLLLALGTRAAPPHLVKWILIGIALLAALPLVVSIRAG